MSYALTPKGSLPPEEMAAVVAAAQALIEQEVRELRVEETTPLWRFSGRWFAAGPYGSLRRPRG